jgi:hypothetical protein
MQYMAMGTLTRDVVGRVYRGGEGLIPYIQYMAVGSFSGVVTVGTKAPVVGTCI